MGGMAGIGAVGMLLHYLTAVVALSARGGVNGVETPGRCLYNRYSGGEYGVYGLCPLVSIRYCYFSSATSRAKSLY